MVLKMNDNEKEYRFSPIEAAAYLEVSVSSLARWRQEEKGPRFYKPAGTILYFKNDLDAWIKGEGDE